MRFGFLAAVISFALFACSSPEPASDAGVDGGSVYVPTEHQFRLVSWNLGNFTAANGEPARVGAILSDLHPDLIALQEVADDAALSALRAELDGGYVGALAPATTTSPDQRVALLWKEAYEVAHGGPTEVHQPTAEFVADPLFPRALLRTRVVLEPGGADGPDELGFDLYAVHLKAGIQAADEDKRVSEASAIAQDVGAFPADDSVIIGDFNEAISDPRSAEVFGAFPVDKYAIPTLSLADAGTETFLPAHLMLDHCVIDRSFAPYVRDGGISVPRLDQTVPNYATDVSDHLPLVLDLTYLR